MNIKKVYIKNYKFFKGTFTIHFDNGINVLVGDNEAGKSTVLEAINLALTGVLSGRYLKNELSQYLFNGNVVEKYVREANEGKNPALPKIEIEVFFSGDEAPTLEGNGNSEKTKHCGVKFLIEFNESYQGEYQNLLSNENEITTIPIEYYHIVWKSFDRENVTSRSIPVKSVLIDSSSSRYQNGSDVYISRIIRNNLEDIEKVRLSQAYRKMKDSFMTDESIGTINKKITEDAKITNKNLKVSVDLSAKNSWETTLMTYLDDVPFHQIGKGEQCVIKTNLALAHKKSQEANLILLEEPENHLSHSKLNELIKGVSEDCEEKQVIISTHSSYVANKLGLEKLSLLNNQNVGRLSELSKETFEFFKKLPGYQTLRLLLCKKAVLVEGDSDELIFQRAHMDENDGHLPIEKGIDVISVALTFERFLEIAALIKQQAAVITDNDKNYEVKVERKYSDYKDIENISIFADNRNELHTLEPQFVDANKDDLRTLRTVLGIKDANYPTEESITEYMKANKAKWALKVFESDKKLKYPDYIKRAVQWCNG